MRFSLMLALVAALLGCAGPRAGAPATARPRKAPVAIEEYFKIRRVSGASFSHDEKLVAYLSDEAGRADVWVRPVSGGEARQVTRAQGVVHSFAFSPAADVLLYEADEGGNELPHIFLTDSTGRAPRDLMMRDPKSARTEFVRWAEDGASFLYLSNRRDPRFMDLYEYALKADQSKMLWQASGKLEFALASRDHRRFVLAETLSDEDSNLYLLERGSHDLVLLTAHLGAALYEAKTFSKDGRDLYFTSNEEGDFAGLHRMNLPTRQVEAVLKESWDVEAADFSRTWRYFFTLTNVGGTPKLALKEADEEVALPAPVKDAALVPIAFSRRDRYLAATLSADTAPANVYVIDLKEKKAMPVAEVLPASLKERVFVSGEAVELPSFDTWKVPAFVYRPDGPGPFPAVIDVHGGPTSQSRRSFDPLRQYLVSKGYVVLVPNVRGSTGYGKRYMRLDNLDLGGGPLRDLLHCKRWLTKEAKVDPAKVVVLGGSYGGYMALAAATLAPREFAAHVDYFGISDLKSLVESMPSHWASGAAYIHKKFGDPANPEHAKYQRERSPLNHADRIVRPVLVVQGENDARVKKDQSDRIVAAMKKRRVPVHYLVLPGEGHGFSRNESRLMAYVATDRFLDRYIGGETAVQVVPE